jgi:hypothetical protein
MVRARLAVAGAPGLEELNRIIATAAAEVFRATVRIGVLDTNAEGDFVRRLDDGLGFTAAETVELLRESRSLVSAA